MTYGYTIHYHSWDFQVNNIDITIINLFQRYAKIPQMKKNENAIRNKMLGHRF